ncbi:MAG: hypothetical protein ABR498_09880 [Candidatus Dormibacteria bacterium]
MWMSASTPRHVRRVLGLSGAALATLVLAACGSSSAAGHGSSSPPVSSVPAEGTGCVTQEQATQIWTQIDNKLNSIEADPKHAGIETVATGTALQGVQQYVQQQLQANGWTESEVDKLQSLTIVSAGCNNGTLEVRVTMTLVKDDYVKANGQVDHQDESVGKTLHFLDFYVRESGVWKESDFQDLDKPAPSQTPQLI